MKIIFSPSKGMEFRKIAPLKNSSEIQFPEKTAELLKILKNFPKEKIAEIMKIKGPLLDLTYDTYQNFYDLPKHRAIELYSGVSFKNLDPENYSEESIIYMEKYLRILSALYGVLTPETLIREYRLDMTMKMGDFSLYNYWKSSVAQEFEPGETIINLASGEFSKLLDRKKYHMIDIEFRQQDGDKLKNISTEAKKMRGKLLDFMIKEKLTSPEGIKKFSQEGYIYSSSLSSSDKIFFLKQS